MNDNPQIFDLHVNPTYAVILPQRSGGNRTKSVQQVKNEINLRNNTKRAIMSPKAIRRLTNSINWLVASAKQKYVYDKKTNRRYNFKVNFVTLTLPTTNHGISDHEFKKDLLHNFINTCRYKFDLKNYVWKVEAQENGNIHVHFTTDCFIHWRDLRSVWNSILLKKGIISKYTEKHEKLSFEEYNNLYNQAGKKDVDKVQKAYEYGVSTKWTDPNTTDVHSVWNVKDLAAYLAKYMGKSEEERREIKGRLWGCSYNLSAENKLTIELCGSDIQKYLEPLHKESIAYKPIELLSKLSNKLIQIGEIFFFKLSDWGPVLDGALYARYNEHRFNIRHGVDVLALKNINTADILPPENIEFDVFADLSHLSVELPF